MSIATSKISPRTARTSFPCGLLRWACSPRSVPRWEREWLSWTKSRAMPPSRYRAAWNVSRKNPRASRWTSGSTRMTPDKPVSMNFTGASPVEPVSVPAHGEEVARLLRVHLQLDAQGADEVVHRARRALVLRAPAARKDVLAAERAAARLQEKPQHLELLRADLHRLVATHHRLAVQVHLHLAELHHRVLLRTRRAAAQERVHPREQLAEAEGLGEVVVGAHAQAEDLVRLHALGGEHQDGGGGSAAAQFLEQLVPVALREHHVEHDQIDIRLQGHAQAGLAVGRHADVVAVLAQVQAQAQGYGAIVFDDQEAGHGGQPAGSTTRKVLPSPSRVSSSIFPPCSSTILREMARPSPVPSVLRESRSSAR